MIKSHRDRFTLRGTRTELDEALDSTLLPLAREERKKESERKEGEEEEEEEEESRTYVHTRGRIIFISEHFFGSACLNFALYPLLDPERSR